MRIVLTALFTVLVAAPIVPGDEPAPTPPELRMIEELVGTWDESVSHKAAEWTPKADTMTAITKRTWALGGMFIRGEGAWQPMKIEYHHLLTYDPVAKAYRSWYFDSSGAMPRFASKGRWDARTRTLLFDDTDDAGHRWVSRHKLTDKDHSEWTLKVTDRAGKVMMDMTGKCVRRKG